MTEDTTNKTPSAGAGGAGGGAKPPAGQPALAAAPGWTRWALIASLAVNLLVLGIVGGAMLRHDRDGPRGGIADVGFGPFTEALSGDDRRALRDAFIRKAPNFRDMRMEARNDLAALIAALRADTWDAESVKANLAKQRDRTVERITIGQDLLLERIATMSPEARRAFADRLEGMMRRPLRDGGKGGNP